MSRDPRTQNVQFEAFGQLLGGASEGRGPRWWTVPHHMPALGQGPYSDHRLESQRARRVSAIISVLQTGDHNFPSLHDSPGPHIGTKVC